MNRFKCNCHKRLQIGVPMPMGLRDKLITEKIMQALIRNIAIHTNNKLSWVELRTDVLQFISSYHQWPNKVYFTFLKTAVISSPNSSFCQFFSSLILLMSLLSSGLWMARVFIIALVNTSEGFISRALAL